ncbi:acetyl-CoA carboxylase biotin carboxyl carrier protein subunit [Sneathiella sp.]|uniref:acetyl-CoA carboxylase biotin carboxyl carrier protein subunit n=1 Tax=Sneathiella sp. TaxID=1964365 RepID=UPI003569837A
MSNTDVAASVTGTVWKIEKSVGDSVSTGDEIMILESMKMEIGVEAPCDGTLSAITVKEQDTISEGQVLAVVTSA